MTEENGITRAQFFRTAWKKSLSTVLDLAENLGTPLDSLTKLGVEWRVVFTGALPEDLPKLVFHQSRPYFLLRQGDKIRAFSGLCPNDSILLVAQPTRGLFCSFCGHHYQFNGLEAKNRLVEYPARADGEKILLALTI